MSVRTRSGATLGLVVTVTVLIVMVGVAVFYLLKIFGGARELQNAADAGTLNIAKQALVEPWVSVDASDPVEVTLAALAASKPTGPGIDLFTYNRLVGQELLVAMNAEADGSQRGIQNAQTVVSRVQALSQLLQNALKDPTQDHNWVSRFFNLAQTNSVRMENQQASGTAIKFVPQYGVTWKTAYMDKGSASNVLLNLRTIQQDSGPLSGGAYSGNGIYPPYITSGSNDGYLTQTTFNYSSVGNGGQLTTNAGGVTWLPGYVTFTFNGIGDVCAVPTEPDSLPHGVSLSQFNQAISTTGLPAWIPPNAFETVSQTLVAKSGAYASNTSAAIIGTVQQTQPANNNNWFWTPNSKYPLPPAVNQNGFVMGMPNGYIIVDNSGYIIPNQGNSNSNPTQFNLPNVDNVDAQELGGAGITVTTNSSGKPTGFADPSGPNGQSGVQNQDNWQQWSQQAQKNGLQQNATQQQFNQYVQANPSPAPPSYGGMYNSDGSPVQGSYQAFQNTAGTQSVVCTDNNTVTQNPVPACNQEDTPGSGSNNPNGLSPFNLAYHPNSTSNSSVSSSSLEAIEELKCEIASLYGPAPSGQGWTGQMPQTVYGPTGLRLYPKQPNNPLFGQEAPYNPPGFSFGGQGFGNGSKDSQGNAVAQGNNGCSYCGAQVCQISHLGSMFSMFDQVATMNLNNGNDPNYMNSRFGLQANGQQYIAQLGGNVTPSGPLSGGPQTVVTASSPLQTNPAQQMWNFLAQRMHEIKPWVTIKEINDMAGYQNDDNDPAVQKVPMGKKMVIYLDKNANFQMVDFNTYFSGSGGPGDYLVPFLGNGTGLINPDGTPRWFQREYAAFGDNNGHGAVNPQLEFGIHDQLFTELGPDNGPGTVNGDLAVYDTAGFWPSSGTYNNLGTIYFQQFVTDHYTLGSSPAPPPTLTGRN